MGAYPRSAWPAATAPSGAPTGSATATAAVTAGVATFTGLADDTAYGAYALVSGEHRIVSFRTPPVSAESGSLPTGGTAGQTLVKQSGTDGDADWETPTSTTVPRSTKTNSYTLALADAGTVIEMNSASPTTVTVPPNSTVAFGTDPDTVIEVARIGAGSVTIVAGSGVTVLSKDSLLVIGNRYGSVVLRKRATNEWILVGDLS